MSVTASLGSFPSRPELLFRELVLRFSGDFFARRFAIQAGIVLQPEKNASRSSRYFSSTVRPALRLSKLSMVFSTKE